MTAVAPPPHLQPIPRSGWSAAGDAANGLSSIASDEVGRMFMPRKTAQRSNSSSSLSSQASTTSTLTNTSQPPSQLNGTSPSLSDIGWAPRKKPARSLWPPPKAESVSGLSNARPQSAPPPSSGPSSAPPTNSSIHAPNSMLPSQHGVQSQVQLNGAGRQQAPHEPSAILHLLPMNGTFERKTMSVPFYPDVVRIGRQTNAKTLPTPINGYFDSKVLSRQHAEVWADRDGKIWIRDIKSSNGTFVNGQRLSQENRDSDPHELREQDMLELGIDIVSEDQKTVVHHKVAARVEHAGIYANTASFMDMNLSDLDPGSSNGMIAPSMQGMGQMRGRQGSVGSLVSNGRPGGMGSNVNAMSHQRSMNFWLTPVTMEQIVKRLNTELRQAKQQSFELTRTTHYMDTLLTKEGREEASKALRSKTSPIKESMKPRFPDPPAPPPQHPLPEKPDATRSTTDPAARGLSRSDTERPKLVSHNTVPIQTDTSHQITYLVDALSAAKKEIDTQGLRVKDLEDKLEQERQKRETAESRALRLEMESLAVVDSPLLPRENLGLPPASTRAGAMDTAASLGNHIGESLFSQSSEEGAMANRLQQRLELMVKEMEEMRQQMDQYRRRAETAEEASAEDRRSLAEMVDKIRTEQKERGSKDNRRRGGRRSRSRSASTSNASTAVMLDLEQMANNSSVSKDHSHVGNGETITPHSKAHAELRNQQHALTFGHGQDSAVAWLRKTGVSPGEPVSAEQISCLERMIEQALSGSGYAGSNGIEHGKGKGALARMTPPDLSAINNAAPFASMLGVVIVGVGLMAWLNGWQRVER